MTFEISDIVWYLGDFLKLKKLGNQSGWVVFNLRFYCTPNFA
jgi:hypothetical protein